LPTPRAIFFVDVIERKETVSNSVSEQHAEECACVWEPPIEELKDLTEGNVMRNTTDRTTSGSLKTQSSSPENTSTENSKALSVEEIETEIYGGDDPFVYETADEFEELGMNHQDNKTNVCVDENLRKNGLECED